MTLSLEIMGGFTGPAGKHVIRIDPDQVSKSDAAEIGRDLEAIPNTAWGGSFLAPHPKPWDFQFTLTFEKDGHQRTVKFHRNQGPPELSRLAEKITDLNSPG